PSMRLAGAALAMLAVSPALMVAALLHPGSLRLSTAAALCAVLAFTLFVAAIQYKLVPVLTWNHRFARIADAASRPRPAELFSARIATVASVAFVVGAVGLVATVVVGGPGLARAAAGAFALGVAVETVQL